MIQSMAHLGSVQMDSVKIVWTEVFCVQMDLKVNINQTVKQSCDVMHGMDVEGKYEIKQCWFNCGFAHRFPCSNAGMILAKCYF